MYKLTRTDTIIRLADGASIPAEPLNSDYQRYLADVANGAEVLPADPELEPEPSRDERLLVAVDLAKEAVSTSGQFTPQQAAVLAAVFDGLGAAITGGGG